MQSEFERPRGTLDSASSPSSLKQLHDGMADPIVLNGVPIEDLASRRVGNADCRQHRVLTSDPGVFQGERFLFGGYQEWINRSEMIHDDKAPAGLISARGKLV